MKFWHRFNQNVQQRRSQAKIFLQTFSENISGMPNIWFVLTENYSCNLWKHKKVWPIHSMQLLGMDQDHTVWSINPILQTPQQLLCPIFPIQTEYCHLINTRAYFWIADQPLATQSIYLVKYLFLARAITFKLTCFGLGIVTGKDEYNPLFIWGLALSRALFVWYNPPFV